MKKILLLREALCVGQYFLPAEDKEWARSLPETTVVDITHESDNQYDGFAAMCTVEGRKIGYVEAKVSPAPVLFASQGAAVKGEIIGHADNKQHNPILAVYVEVVE